MALDEARLLDGEGCATAGHRVGNAAHVQAHHIGVALEEDHGIVLLYLTHGPVEAIEHGALGVDDGLGAVDILGLLVGSAGQLARAKGYGLAQVVEDGNHPPAAKAVVELLRLIAVAYQPCGLEFLVGVAVGAEGSEQPLPPCRAEAEAKPGDVAGVVAALLEEVVIGELLPGGCAGELVVIVGHGSIHGSEGALFEIVGSALGLGELGGSVDLVALGELVGSLEPLAMLHEHHKFERIAAKLWPRPVYKGTPAWVHVE